MAGGVYPSEGEDLVDVPLDVGAAHAGLRLDRFLRCKIHRLSRTRIQRIIESGSVRNGGSGAILDRASVRVKAGDTVVLRRPAADEPPVVLDYRILHEDAEILVLDKPAGLPVHPTARYHRNTLTALLRTRLGEDHPWILAHRLDRETSGVLILGRRGSASRALKQAFQAREVRKTYLALVHGRMTEPRQIDVPLGFALHSRIRIKIGPRPVEMGGHEASTRVEPVAHGWFRQEPVTLVRVEPKTGRQHQIRVHLAHIGHGVVGDKMYGLDEQAFLDVVDHGASFADLEARLGLGRHALHAESLELLHPASATRIRFTCPWPAELARILSVPERALARSLRRARPMSGSCHPPR